MGYGVLRKRARRKTPNAKGMSIKQLYANRRHNPDFVNSAFIQLRRVWPLVKGQVGLAFKTLTVDPKTTPPKRTHYQRIYPADPKYVGKLVDCPKVKMLCDCERWKFMWEYACFKKGAADIVMGNGRPPTEMNLRGVATGCKHLLRDMQYIIKNRL